MAYGFSCAFLIAGCLAWLNDNDLCDLFFSVGLIVMIVAYAP